MFRRLRGGLGSKGGGGGGGIKPIFYPLITDLINQFGGDSAAATIRNSTASVNVYDDTATTIIRTAAINEHRAEGYRRVENLFTRSDNFEHADWTKTAGATVSGRTVTFAAQYSGIVQNEMVEVGDVVILHTDVQWVSGNTNLSIQTDSGGVTPITVDGTRKRYSSDPFTIAIAGARQMYPIIDRNSSGFGSVNVWEAQLEKITGATNQNPSEYVPTTSADVSKYLTTTNANTVASNVVTEAVGVPLFPTKNINGASWNDTKPDWATGAWAAGSECNYLNKWYSTVAGGTDSATFGDTITWVEQGLHNNIYGLLTEPAATNVYPVPETVATQTVPVASTGDYTLSVKGAGSIAITAGTATATGYATASEGTDVTINVTGTGDVTCTLTGALDTAQMELGSVSTSFTPSTRATEAGTTEWDIAGNFSNTAGVVATTVTFASDKAASAAIRSILGVDAVGSFLYQNTATGAIDSTDGTNVATNTTAYVAGNAYDIFKRWDTATNKQQIGIWDRSTYGATAVWGAETTYDGAHTLGTLIELSIGIIEPLRYRNLSLIYGQDMTTASIEVKLS